MSYLSNKTRFSQVPRTNIQRSAWNMPSQHKTCGNFGDLIPFHVQEVLPGDTFNLDCNIVARMSTLLSPVMDNAFLDFSWFFVPNRLVWEGWEKLMGQNDEAPWAVDQSTIHVPMLSRPSIANSQTIKNSIADYMGVFYQNTASQNSPLSSFNSLPFRAYCKIWNDWYRDENYSNPAVCPRDSVDRVGAFGSGGSAILDTFQNRLDNAHLGWYPLPVFRYHDYFSSCLPAPQKGSAVTVPAVGGEVPVVTRPYNHDVISTTAMRIYTTGSIPVPSGSPLGTMVGNIGAVGYAPAVNVNDYNTGVTAPVNLWANLNAAQQLSINALRQAVQVQRLLERDARGGTRYTEFIRSHFGVISPDSRLQRSEFLGGKHVPINVTQVVQTSETTTNSNLGELAAWSLTANRTGGFVKSFTEHGFVIGVMCARTERTYQQGVERFWSRTNRLDYYLPVLAHLSEQPVMSWELLNQVDSALQFGSVWGYQEAWADYRYKPSRTSSSFRSAFSGSLDFWHYGDKYANFQTLTPDWLRETPVNVDRTLAVTSSEAEQLIFDIYINNRVARPMPLYSVPGMLDHF